MSSFHSENIIEFLEPLNLFEIADDTAFRATQLGKNILVYEESFPDLENADLIIVGIGETRGSGLQAMNNRAANNVRTEFYRLFHWHQKCNGCRYWQRCFGQIFSRFLCRA
ncbi:MAG: hypothetical protein PW786_07450 [Arachidicoccus sp.]|nr:hypothetical protein [Arachidicoccus sp.]